MSPRPLAVRRAAYAAVASLALVSLSTTSPAAAATARPVDPAVSKASAQRTLPTYAGRSTAVLRAGEGSPGTAVLPPARSGAAGTNNATVATSEIRVNYYGFSPAAQRAFQYAADRWEQVIVSPVPIEVDAYFNALGPDVLGQAGAYLYVDEPGNESDRYTPGALANRLAKTDIDPMFPDIEAEFNSSFANWYFGLDARPGPGEYDFVTVVMHELGHGLGVAGAMDVAPDGTGAWGYGPDVPVLPNVYDDLSRDAAGMPLLSYPNKSTRLGSALESGALYFDGPRAKAANAGQPARLYSPEFWEGGSSYSHLDEDTYRPGNANSLMTPFLDNDEAIHDPGPIVRGLLLDIGWGTPTALADKARALGSARLGAVSGGEYTVPGRSGRARNYAKGRIYYARTTGVGLVEGAILKRYLELRGPAGTLGLPLRDEQAVHNGRASYFSGGRVYWSGSTGAHAVQGKILDKYLQVGGTSSVLGLPVRDEVAVHGGRGSYFVGGRVYHAAASGAHPVTGEILAKYLAIGGTSSVLGLPRTDEVAVRGGRASYFVGGRLYHSAATGAHAVSGPILVKYLEIGGTSSRLGLPSSDQVADAAGRTQNFPGGVIRYDAATNTTTVTYKTP